MTGPGPGRRERFERYIGRMERGEFWLAHEELEELWLQRREPVLRGLIHLAAALVHAGRGNRRGARTKARSCIDLLGREERVMGLRLGPVRELAARLAERQGAAPDPTAGVPMAGWYEGTVDAGALERADLPYRVRRYDDGYRIGRDPARRDD